MGEAEGRAREAGVIGEEAVGDARGAVHPREGDVGAIGAALGLEAEADQRLIELVMELGGVLVRADAGPDGVGAAARVELADAVERDFEGGEMDLAERERDVLGHAAVDLADEAQRDVELRVGLPARAGDAAHQREQALADRGGGPEADEQAVHDGSRLTLNRAPGKPVLLVLLPWNTDIPAIRQMCRAKEFKMANWSDPQPRAGYASQAGTRADATDAGLRAYMLSIYNYMASGVLLTGIVSLLFAKSGMVDMLVAYNEVGRPVGMSGLGWIAALAPLAIVMVMSFGQNRIATPTLQLLFWAYALLMGVSLSTIFLAYTDASIAQCFFATAAAFAGLSLYGYTTKRDLGPIGTFLIMGLVGLIVASLLNAFVFQSGQMGLIISALGVLIFAGLTAYDTQKLKLMYDYVRGTDMLGKVVIMGALTLYLDFINMFLLLLRLFGSSRD